MKQATSRRVGLIGLGTMGGIMARTLVEAGHEVCGHDPSSACRARLRRCGGRALASNTEVARAADVLICSLPSSAALHTVVAAAALRRQGWQLVDAPISGTAMQQPEQVWIMYLSGTKLKGHRRDGALTALPDAAARHLCLGLHRGPGDGPGPG
jgi:3-hydroxyisobutyrate dehydrogenase-like beta-hydroxyacid dehydrogenase